MPVEQSRILANSAVVPPGLVPVIFYQEWGMRKNPLHRSDPYRRTESLAVLPKHDFRRFEAKVCILER